MFFGKVADLGVAKPVRKLTDYSFDIIETMKKDSGISEFFVTDENNKICGIITRRNIFEKFSGQFGYNLSKRIRAADILQTDFLIVDESMSVDKVAELAMKRAPDFVYDAVAVTKNGEYLCSVTVKDLLLSSIQVQLKQAADASPLTGLRE
jgi:predicted transcriptional regulator